ncbi:MAG: chromatin protein Cren7 [Desulfurococcales archaeon]|nr:chromatin protein Cren7 [Desulfurococcales archaeon]
MTIEEKNLSKLSPVNVFNPYTGKEESLVPKKVWKIRENLKMGQFQCPHTGRFFKAKVPIDYPEVN